jgi:hypothetical protein
VREKNMKKLKVGFILLAVLTVAMAATTVYATSEEPLKPFCFLDLKAHELAEAPSAYIPENETLDPYVVEAVQNPGTLVEANPCLYNPNTGHWTYADNITCTFPDLSRKYYTINVVYEGKFYVIHEGWASPSFEFLGIKSRLIRVAPAGWTVLGVFWVIGGVIALRNKKKLTAVR